MELRNDLTPSQVERYISRNRGSEREVGINSHKWTRCGELFTTAASTCFVPVVVDEDSGFLGLGHYYSSIVTSRALMADEAAPLEDYLSYTRKAGQMVTEGRRLQMYLFGGTVSDKEYLQRRDDAVMKSFRVLGIECISIMPPEPQSILELLIANSRDKTIRYFYKPDRL